MTARDEMIAAGVLQPAPPDRRRAVALPAGAAVLRLTDKDRERAREHMAKLRTDLSLRVVEKRGGRLYLTDPLYDARRYHGYLTELFDTGRITKGTPIPKLPIWHGGEDVPEDIMAAYRDDDPAG